MWSESRVLIGHPSGQDGPPLGIARFDPAPKEKIEFVKQTYIVVKFWTTSVMGSQKGAAKRQQNINDFCRFIVPQTQLTFFTGFGNKQVILGFYKNIFLLYNNTFIDQACSTRMAAGY